MLFNIPQFIDKEDKIVGPLTAKQLGWSFGAGGVLIFLWAILDISAFIMASVPVIAIFGALAFYRPNNMSLIAFIFSSVRFFFRPKMYVWKRVPDVIKIQKKTRPAKTISRDTRIINNDRISEITKLLDQK
ncbi:MAG: PrgI family protein [Parcubacteria group bacterium]